MLPKNLCATCDHFYLQLRHPGAWGGGCVCVCRATKIQSHHPTHYKIRLSFPPAVLALRCVLPAGYPGRPCNRPRLQLVPRNLAALDVMQLTTRCMCVVSKASQVILVHDLEKPIHTLPIPCKTSNNYKVQNCLLGTLHICCQRELPHFP